MVGRPAEAVSLSLACCYGPYRVVLLELTVEISLLVRQGAVLVVPCGVQMLLLQNKKEI